MNIYNYLKKDHQKVAALMEEITLSTNATERKELFEQMSAELLLHAKTEEQTFYKALEERGGKQLQEKAEHAEEEHDEVEELIKTLRSLDPADSQWLVNFGCLKHAVEHHVEEEEGPIFEKARKVLTENKAEELADQMETLKERKGMPPKAGSRATSSPGLRATRPQ